MFINRITFERPRDGEFSDDELIAFNRTASYFEELVFHNLPKKTNLGGYGFFHNRLFASEIAKDDIKAYGQIIDFNHRSESFRIDQFLKLSVDERMKYLLKLFEKAIHVISKGHQVDTDKFSECIARSLDTGTCIKQKLKVSKTFKTRKLKVDIFRVIEPEEQRVLCRILNNKNDVLDEFDLERDTNVYSTSSNYRKSIWNESTLCILDRFDREYNKVDVSNYL